MLTVAVASAATLAAGAFSNNNRSFVSELTAALECDSAHSNVQCF